MINYKLQNNVKTLGKDFYGQDDDFEGGAINFHPKRAEMDLDNDLNDEIFKRKQAWAELEKEQEDVKSGIKNLMRRAPESAVIDNPLMADRVGSKIQETNYRVPQDVTHEKRQVE